jgi:hypothetical protein
MHTTRIQVSQHKDTRASREHLRNRGCIAMVPIRNRYNSLCTR